MRPSRLSTIFVPALTVFFAGLAAADVAVSGRIADETGLAVAFAKVELRAVATIATSDIAGGFSALLSAPGRYRIHASRTGFFVFDTEAELREGSNHVQITLNHLQELFQSVDVDYSPPTIDPQQTAEQKQLISVEIMEAPYPASQDLRNAFPLLQGVVQDVNGRLHFNGGANRCGSVFV